MAEGVPAEVLLDIASTRARDGLDIAKAITGGDLTRTITGASTLTVEIHDPHRVLLNSPDLQRAIDFRYDGTWFRLVKLAKSGAQLTLTFEDRDVAYLRRHTKPRAVSRGKSTRAQFVRTLVREVGRGQKGRKIDFFCPEVNEKQPIGKKKQDSTPKKRDENDREKKKQKGLDPDAELSVKGMGATDKQRENGEAVLDVADSLGAGPKATKALMEAVIVESGIMNLTYGDRDSLGILQVRVSTSGSRSKSLDIEWCCTKFLKEGFYRDPLMGSGGAMDKARRFPSAKAGRVAQATQGSGVPGAYDIFADEAQQWLDAYGGVSGTDTGGTSRTVTTRKKYEFSRGKAGKREDSWTAIQRLAEEVNWRAFMDRGTLYFVTEERLIAAKAKYIVSEDTDGINWIDFDIDQGKKSSEIHVSARTDLFDVPIGSVMAIRGMGFANGRYIVSEVRRPLFEADTEITLKAATKKLPEPDAETTSKTIKGKDTPAGSLRERIVSVAEESRDSYNHNPHAWFYSQQGSWNVDDPTRPPKRGKRSDCSQWVAAVYKKAGAPAPGPNYNGIYTGNMAVKGKTVSLDSAQPGDIILWADHVELYVGPGPRTIGHGSTPVDYGTYDMKPGGHVWSYDFLDE